jgi:hypothetical protein
MLPWDKLSDGEEKPAEDPKARQIQIQAEHGVFICGLKWNNMK